MEVAQETPHLGLLVQAVQAVVATAVKVLQEVTVLPTRAVVQEVEVHLVAAVEQMVVLV